MTTMNGPVIFSIVSANYLAYAQTLMESVREHHPESRRYVFLADEGAGDLALDPDLFTCVPARDLSVPHFDHFAFRYSVLELNTALKPFAMRWLAARHGSDPLVYLDPDILVVAPLLEVLEATSRGALAVITPHLTAPLTDDGHPDELSIMRAGAYNLGFIALGPHPMRPALAAWWANKLEFSALVDPDSGLFTDQKWIDLLPGLFPDVTILRHPGYNLAYWNLPHRAVTVEGGRALVNGEPIVFVHFSGVDLRHPDTFSRHQNRFDSRSIGDLRPLYLRYLTLLRENGFDRFSRIPYAWARLRDGTPITPEMRAAFRERFDVGRADESPDPFGLTARALKEDVPLLTQLSRYVLRIYPLLRTRRPFRWMTRLISSRTRRALRRYLGRESTPPATRAAQAATRAAGSGFPISRPTGLELHPRANVIGYLKGEFGVAEAARSLIRAAQVGGVDLALMNVDASEAARAEDLRLTGLIGDTAPYPVNIICVNADQTEVVMSALGSSVVEGRYNIGRWFWELANFPPAWQSAIGRVDEIWTATSFTQTAIASATGKPVRVVRMAMNATPSRPYHRSEFGLPDDRFVFLFSFDFSSFMARKNPQATIAAFQSAFPTADERVALVLKSTNGERNRDELRRLKAIVGSDSRIQLRDGFMSRDEFFGLESVVDSYVSLHRSEGFGLGLAESMLMGKPVIGTAYSGNLEFMDASNSCLVGYRLVDVRPGEYPCPEGQVWAEPDLDQCAYHMRRLVEDTAFASDLGRRARDHITSTFNDKAVGESITEELTRILDHGLPV